MNVLSLFDGISCACVALERCALPINTYTAVEIDKYATAVSQKNYPEIIRFNDVRTFHPTRHYDLLIGGSPCQDLSIAKKDRKGLGGDRSGLFWEYIRIKNEAKPTWFVLENVASMPKKDRDIITAEMGVEPVLFNASLVSAQSRKRLFWTNIPFELPADRGIVLKDILQPDGEVDERMVVKGKAFCLTATYSKASPSEGEIKQRTMVKVGYIGEGEQYGQGGQAHRVYDPSGKTPTLSSGPALVLSKHQQTNLRDVEQKAHSLTATMHKGSHANGTTLIMNEDKIRKLTPIECERLQGLPDNYTEGVATTNRYKCLGNAFNVDVVTCILERLTRPM
jgi:DNA (cytosine-5)-methyltransferase 3A